MRSDRAIDAAASPPLRPLARSAHRSVFKLPEGMELFAKPAAPLAIILALAVMVFAPIAFARTAGLVAALWGASAFAAAIWLRSGRGWGFDIGFVGLIGVGIAAGELMAGNSVTLTILFTVAQLIEVSAAVVLVRRFCPRDPFASVEGVSRFLLCAAVAAPLPGALLAATYLSHTHGHDFVAMFQTWWFGHALGFAVISPVVMTMTRQRLRRLFRPIPLIESAGLQATVAAVTLAMFWQTQVPITFLLAPILMLVAVRLRLLGATVALAIVALIGIGMTMVGRGPFALNPELDRTAQVMMAQLFVVLGCLPTMLIAVVLEERDRLAEAARQGQRRAELASGAKSRLLANVAHEIKSPIGGVIGIADLWRDGKLGPVTETQAEMAAMLVKTARQVETLSHDLLDVARAESGSVRVEVRPTDVVGVLEDVRRAAGLRHDMGEMRVDLAVSGENLIALADSQRLAQVIENLTSNALKYARSGGEVTLYAARQVDEIRIEVRDRGPGLSPEKQAQLFEPFNRLGLERSAVEGHGVGLALAKRLIELQGGRIGVESAVGAGAVFWITLPVA